MADAIMLNPIGGDLPKNAHYIRHTMSGPATTLTIPVVGKPISFSVCQIFPWQTSGYTILAFGGMFYSQSVKSGSVNAVVVQGGVPYRTYSVGTNYDEETNTLICTAGIFFRGTYDVLYFTEE